MLRTKLSSTILGAGLVLSTGALADSHASETGNFKVGAQYNAGLIYDDHGLEDVDGAPNDPSTTTALGLNAAKIIGSGEAAKDVSFHAEYNLLNNQVEKAYATWKHSDLLSFQVGRDKANQGGYENMSAGYSHNTPWNPYIHNLPFETYADMVAVHVALAGALEIQLVNDKTAEEDATGALVSGRKNEENKNPAFNIQWMGDFSGWMPLVQIGSYDLNKSTYFTLGVKGNVAGLGVWLDYTSDSRKNFARAGGALTGDKESDTLTAMNLNLSYALSGFTPWIEYKSFDYKQGGTDSDANASGAAQAEAAKAADKELTTEEMFGDNGTSISVGANCNAFGDGYVPYLALTSQSGKFFKPDGKTETLSNMTIKFGVMGAF